MRLNGKHEWHKEINLVNWFIFNLLQKINKTKKKKKWSSKKWASHRVIRVFQSSVFHIKDEAI